MRNAIEQGFVRALKKERKPQSLNALNKKEDGKVNKKAVFTTSMLAALTTTGGALLFSGGGSSEESLPTPTSTSEVTAEPIQTNSPEVTSTLKPAPKEGEPFFDFTIDFSNIPDRDKWNAGLNWIEQNRDRELLADYKEVYISFSFQGTETGPNPPGTKYILINVLDGGESMAKRSYNEVCGLFGDNGQNNIIPEGGIIFEDNGSTELSFPVPESCNQ